MISYLGERGWSVMTIDEEEGRGVENGQNVDDVICG